LKRFDAIVAGELYVDLMLSGFDFWPRPGAEAFARSYHRDIGGGASITACGLAKLGSRTSVFGIVGSEWGEWVVERLNRNGVDTAGVKHSPDEPTGFTVALSGPEDRAFLTYAGANREFRAAFGEAALEGRFAEGQHIHLAWCPPLDDAVGLMDSLRRSGCSISLDVGWHEPWLRDPRALALVRHIDVFFPNETEALAMTGERDPESALACFRDAGARGVALKLGAAGAALLWNGRIWRIAAHPVNPVDTTGAGDCFDAGFLHYWLQGAPAEMCLRAANVCGGLSTEAHGGLAGFPTATRLKEILEEPCEKSV
jgi:sugar/nucleoside kinase (ribokinase family)